MKNPAYPENGQRGDATSPTPVLDAVSAEVAALTRAMIEDRGRMDRQRRRVEALLWDGEKAAGPKLGLEAMERAYSLKEIYRDHLIEVSGGIGPEPRLHDYDIEERAQRFGVTGAVLRRVVAEIGPDPLQAEAALAHHAVRIAAAPTMDGSPVTSKGRATNGRGRAKRREKEEANG